MASSKTEICNIALSHLGQGQEIANMDTENSEAASACRRFYELAKDEVMRDFDWPFLTRFASLALVDEDPTTEWAYSYRYPTDCLKIRRILSGDRNDSLQSRITYKVAQDDTGSLVLTDMQNAEMEYTYKEDDTGKFPADFVAALSYKLAFYISPRLTKGDPFKLRDSVSQMYVYTVTKAARNAFNEEGAEQEKASLFERSRG